VQPEKRQQQKNLVIQKCRKNLKIKSNFMNIVGWKIVDALKCKWTYGYITKHNRSEKSHINDAFVIAGGTEQIRKEQNIGKQTQ
jgi:hypothetical protein